MRLLLSGVQVGGQRLHGLERRLKVIEVGVCDVRVLQQLLQQHHVAWQSLHRHDLSRMSDLSLNEVRCAL